MINNAVCQKTRTQRCIIGVHNMKEAIILAILFSTLGFNIARAQENDDQDKLSRGIKTKQDHIQDLYKGSQEEMLAAVTWLSESGSNGANVVDALVFGLQQGTLNVQREYSKVTNDFIDVRAASAKLLGGIGDPMALQYLYISLRYDHDQHVKSSAAYAIGVIGLNESIDYIVRTIKSADNSGSDDKLIISCIEAIGEIGGQDGFGALIETLRGDYSKNVKMAARESLKKIQW